MREIIERTQAILSRAFPTAPYEFGDLDDHPMADVDQGHVRKLSQRMRRRGYTQKPVVAVGESRRVIDGRHRIEAARLAGVDVLTVVVSEEWYERQVSDFPAKSLEQIADLALRKARGF